MNPLCKCTTPGYCDRHQIIKSPRLHTLCQLEANTPDQGLKYWLAWEQGRLGATAPDNPDIGEEPRVIEPGRAYTTIGNRMRERIKYELGMDIPCGECKIHLKSLNRMSVQEARDNRGEIVSQIAARAQRKAPRLWQRLAVTIDKALNLGETERRIGRWLDDCIEQEEKEEPG